MKKTIILGLAMAFVMAGCSLTRPVNKIQPIGLEAAKAKAVDFINNNLMQPGTQVSIKEAVEEEDLYKMVVNMPQGQEITSYLTKDGKKFFPQVMDIAEYEQKAKEKQAQQSAAETQTVADTPKNDKPKVEVFVMSHCPYGTQIVKGVLSVVETLDAKIDFALKFCDYAMHGKKELDEQLNQHCIQKNEPQKLISYLKCFLEADKGAECLKTTGINTAKLNTCVSAIDKEFKITELFNDKSTWVSGRFPQFNVNKEEANNYGVKGSPGLVINGQKISSGRDAASLLAAVCAGFDNPPEECGTELSSATPSPGFGFGTTGGDSGGGCGG